MELFKCFISKHPVVRNLGNKRQNNLVFRVGVELYTSLHALDSVASVVGNNYGE